MTRRKKLIALAAVIAAPFVAHFAIVKSGNFCALWHAAHCAWPGESVASAKVFASTTWHARHSVRLVCSK